MVGTEKSTTTLAEMKARMEMLISYYRGLGEDQNGFVQELEFRLRGLSDPMCQDGRHLVC